MNAEREFFNRGRVDVWLHLSSNNIKKNLTFFIQIQLVATPSTGKLKPRSRSSTPPYLEIAGSTAREAELQIAEEAIQSLILFLHRRPKQPRLLHLRRTKLNLRLLHRRSGNAL